MKSSGSNSSGATNANYNPTNNTTTPYGQATPTNYQWQSFLPESGTASAQLGDAAVQRYADGSTAPSATSTPLLPAADTAAPVTSDSGGMSSSMKNFLAELMLRSERDKYLKYTNKESASGGSRASGSFGGSSGGLY